ncbi:hypothetical protein [Cupriavidus taiwanensis]|uniref:hypothetical protein n=1 Tax=Cupriavidus taiwanensis TaxID=164546 RepID=UPI000E1065A4|nr:hypothetical protein [Cupriavidus taiwanensis]SOY56828.1 hypothetical protein CBM2592_A90123 [Cupriavidus taiwanensis]SOY90741.1 hypothetical protein CBM2591_A90122 [Cupriavidus taiwanensis]SOZ63535.1 hypothetical protein CBM2617_A70099 [Cupriavidus taiwanensis]SOZ82560.1 hypothetical protein CBM2618_A80100 [Cupriavidus taiwanensis]SOZ84420.1 hypothetical protein CBM2622_A80099 [Cupriavidus taiwanensis]
MNALFPFFIPTKILTPIVNLMLWHLPEFDYNRYWREQTMRSHVLPHIPGI